MRRSLLPIGTVVQLTDAENLMMICGYAPISRKKKGYVYDYSGFLYPAGYDGTMVVYQFDNEQIERVIAAGYQDTESFAYLDIIQDRIMDIKEQVAEAADDVVGAAETGPADGDDEGTETGTADGDGEGTETGPADGGDGERAETGSADGDGEGTETGPADGDGEGAEIGSADDDDEGTETGSADDESPEADLAGMENG